MILSSSKGKFPKAEKQLLLLLFTILTLHSALAQDTIVTIKGYAISGNKRTREVVFLRETGKLPGDTIHNPATRMGVWQKRISGLNLFNRVQVFLRNDSVCIGVTERIYQWGLPRLEWADRNFNVWWQTKDPARLIYGATLYFNNLRGLNHNLAVTVIHGYNHIYELQYNRPFSHYSHGWSYGVKLGYWSNHELWYRTNADKLEFFRVQDHRVQANSYLGLLQKKRLSYWGRVEMTEGINRTVLDSSAFAANPKYLLSTRMQNEYYLLAEWVSDHRDQRDYPTSGYLLRVGFRNSLLSSGDSMQYLPQLQVRATWFKPLRQKLVLAMAFASRICPYPLPYNMGRQLGYQTDYVRGYEPFVFDGRGMVLGRAGLRQALWYNHVLNLGDKKPLKNYRKVPVSIWLNIFADAGHILYPVLSASNPQNRNWLAGVGSGIDVTAWYSALARMEYSINAMGKGYFNLSFKNAF